MSVKPTIYILMYDITHDRTLQKTARLLQQNGYERINYSVWYGCNDPNKNPEMKKKLKYLLSNELAKGSRMYILPVKIKDMDKMRTYDGKKIKDMEYWLGKQNTIFFT